VRQRYDEISNPLITSKVSYKSTDQILPEYGQNEEDSLCDDEILQKEFSQNSTYGNPNFEETGPLLLDSTNKSNSNTSFIFKDGLAASQRLQKSNHKFQDLENMPQYDSRIGEAYYETNSPENSRKSDKNSPP
jgi:hypothetical protein